MSTANQTVLPEGIITPSVQYAIVDPGNAGAIPVVYSGVCPMVTAGAETRTVAAPSLIGQTLVLVLDTDGGDSVVTFSAAINIVGNTIATFADAGDTLSLVAISKAGVLSWSVQANDALILS